MPWTLITGGSKGVGEVLSKKLATLGKDIVIHFRGDVKRAHELAKSLRKEHVKAEILQGDFSTIEGTNAFISAYLDTFPETEGLINNVGNYFVAPCSSTDPETFRNLFEVNLFTPFSLSHALIPSLKRHKGFILNIGVSGLRKFQGSIHAPLFLMTKLGLYQMTLSLAKELAPFHVNVNMVSPGYLENSVEKKPSPMGREGSLEDIAHVAAFLINEKSSFITGQNIEVAGGF